MKRRLRVAMIAPPWLPIPPPSYGGIENVISTLVPALEELGAEVSLFTVGNSKVHTTKKRWLYKHGQYNVIERPYYDALPILIAHLSAALNEIKKDNQFDIIHDHNPYIGPAMLAYSRGLPPILHTLHGPPFSTPDQLDLGIPDNKQMWQQLAKTDRIHYVNISYASKAFVPKSLKSLTLEPVHNGIKVEQFPFKKEKSDYFMTLARFHPNKGQVIAIKACKQQGYRLKMAGTVCGMTRPKQVMLELINPLSIYRSQIDFRYFSDEVFPELEDGQIEYVGDLDNAAKLKMLSKAQALLAPIQWEEPFGMAVIEALACGTPVIAIARGAMPEIIKHGFNGFLAKDNREFKSYLKHVGDIDPKNCRQSVEKRFSANLMAKNYLERYDSILSRNS